MGGVGAERGGDQPDVVGAQGVVKCVFMGIPLSVVDRLTDRADPQLAAMLSALAAERAAAGRRMPDDALTLLNRLTVATTPRKQA